MSQLTKTLAPSGQVPTTCTGDQMTITMRTITPGVGAGLIELSEGLARSATVGRRENSPGPGCSSAVDRPGGLQRRHTDPHRDEYADRAGAKRLDIGHGYTAGQHPRGGYQ